MVILVLRPLIIGAVSGLYTGIRIILAKSGNRCTRAYNNAPSQLRIGIFLIVDSTSFTLIDAC